MNRSRPRPPSWPPPHGGSLVFESRIKVHNVSPEELGGLLWALTLGDLGQPEGPHRHMLGRGRAWGFGQVRPELRLEGMVLHPNKRGTSLPTADACVTAFKAYVARKALEQETATAADFETLPAICDLRAQTNATMGAEFSDLLQFPVDTPTNDADAVVAGYMALRNETFRDKTPVQAADAFSLPRFPWEDTA